MEPEDETGGDGSASEASSSEPYTTEELLWEPPARSEADAARPKTDRPVFLIAGALAIAFVVWGAADPEQVADVSQRMLDNLIHNAGWGFVLAASAFVVISLWLAFSKYGDITLGRDDEQPEFNTVSWISMLFATGMGIGLMFFGVAEPLGHFSSPPPGTGGADAATAMATTLFHWTLHPWAIYAVVGLAIAYGTYRRGRRQLISAVFTPLIGEKAANGPIGRLIDVLAIFATLFGSATSLGLGALQIAGGLQQLGWVEVISSGLLVGIIAALMVAFVVSAVSGVERGIQWLSNINMGMAALILLFLLVVGPTVFILDMIPTSLGAYLADFFDMSGRTEASGGENVGGWLTDWTIFYWAWWISWTPFVGMFIGKISRGRTIRQFVTGVILVPSSVSLIWFAILGGTAIDLQSAGVDIYGDGSNQEGMLYGLLAQFPWATAISAVVAVLVAIFFITGADSASIVMGTLSQRGANVPHRGVTVFWGVLMAAVAAIMLVSSGGESTGLDGLQRLTILVAAPWTVVMLLMCVSLIKDLQRDPKVIRSHKAREVVTAAVVTGAREHDGDFQLVTTPADDTPEDAGEAGGADADPRTGSTRKD
ncbi:BCCT family transporter [Nocardiopsis sp. CNT-189]